MTDKLFDWLMQPSQQPPPAPRPVPIPLSTADLEIAWHRHCLSTKEHGEIHGQ